jgi:hypothetical protein
MFLHIYSGGIFIFSKERSAWLAKSLPCPRIADRWVPGRLQQRNQTPRHYRPQLRREPLGAGAYRAAANPADPAESQASAPAALAEFPRKAPADLAGFRQRTTPADRAGCRGSAHVDLSGRGNGPASPAAGQQETAAVPPRDRSPKVHKKTHFTSHR